MFMGLGYNTGRLDFVLKVWGPLKSLEPEYDRFEIATELHGRRIRRSTEIRTGYAICGVQCKMKMRGPLFRIKYKFQDDDSRALNQLQGPPERRACGTSPVKPVPWETWRASRFCSFPS